MDGVVMRWWWLDDGWCHNHLYIIFHVYDVYRRTTTTRRRWRRSGRATRGSSRSARARTSVSCTDVHVCHRYQTPTGVIDRSVTPTQPNHPADRPHSPQSTAAPSSGGRAASGSRAPRRSSTWCPGPVTWTATTSGWWRCWRIYGGRGSEAGKGGGGCWWWPTRTCCSTPAAGT